MALQGSRETVKDTGLEVICFSAKKKKKKEEEVGWGLIILFSLLYNVSNFLQQKLKTNKHRLIYPCSMSAILLILSKGLGAIFMAWGTTLSPPAGDS